MPFKLTIPGGVRFRRPEVKKTVIVIIAAALLLVILFMGTLLRRLTPQYAAAAARESVLSSVNGVIREKMASGEYDYNYFVRLEKDEAGRITALTTNMSRINALSAEITRDVVAMADKGSLSLGIPIGSLSGSGLLSGRGLKIPVKVVLLTSSKAEFLNEFSSAGINQTKHQIILEVTVNCNIVLPWGNDTDSVKTSILVAETVIVGQVPDNYVNFDGLIAP